jgi:hypothetical protein
MAYPPRQGRLTKQAALRSNTFVRSEINPLSLRKDFT